MCDTCRPVVGLLCMTHSWVGGWWQGEGESIKAEEAPILYTRVKGAEVGKNEGK